MKKLTSKEIKEFVSKPLFDEKTILNKNSKWPRISIVVPSYNQGQFIEQTILSVLNQNYPETEFIIIDGGSTDNTINIIKKHEKYIDYWISENDRGQANAINKGFEIATGDWIGWQNSDDLYMPRAFFRLKELIESYQFVDVFYGNKICVDESLRVLRRQFYCRPSKYIYIKTGMTICNQSAFIKRNLFREHGYLDERLNYAMDHEFFLRLILNGISMRHDLKLLGASRYHKDSKSCGDNKLKWTNEKLGIYRNLNITLKNINNNKKLVPKLLRIGLLFFDNRISLLKEALIRVNKKFVAIWKKQINT